MSVRFYLDPQVSFLRDDRAVLGGDEAHHFSRVMRGKVGDEIVLFDGTGLSWTARVQCVSKTGVELQVLETIPDTIESPLRLTVATALPKGDRQRFLIEKLAELGVARLVPLHLQRSVARANDGTLDKLRRYVIEAAKQCGRNVLMEITREMTMSKLDEFLRQRDGETGARWLLHPASLGALDPATPKSILSEPLPDRATVVIGPEGSFTDEEVRTALAAGFRTLDLGARILRTETAGIAAAALLLTYAG